MLDAFLKMAYAKESRANPLEAELARLAPSELEDIAGPEAKGALAFAARFATTPLFKEACALAEARMVGAIDPAVLALLEIVLEKRAAAAESAAPEPQPEGLPPSSREKIAEQAAEALGRTLARKDARTIADEERLGAWALAAGKEMAKIALPVAALLRGGASGLGSLAAKFIKNNPLQAAGMAAGAAVGGARGAAHGGGVTGALTGAVGGGVLGGLGGRAAQGVGTRLRAGQGLRDALANTGISGAQKAIGALT